MANIRVYLLISGKVQGVYFRQNLKQISKRYNINGWVKNLENGKVEAILEGDEKHIKEVIEWCHVGPSGARVDNVEIKFEEYKGEFNSFTIKY